MSEHTAENDACTATLDYQPLDPKLSRRVVRCIRPAAHVGLHHGDDGLPFGPAVPSVTFPGVNP